jgi:hypothetical protein
VVLEADSLMFECKAGPYRPVGEVELAHWAPREGEAGVAEYQACMRAQFDRCEAGTKKVQAADNATCTFFALQDCAKPG